MQCITGDRDGHAFTSACIYIYIYTHTIYIHTYIYIYIHTHTHTYSYICRTMWWPSWWAHIHVWVQTALCCCWIPWSLHLLHTSSLLTSGECLPWLRLISFLLSTSRMCHTAHNGDCVCVLSSVRSSLFLVSWHMKLELKLLYTCTAWKRTYIHALKMFLLFLIQHPCLTDTCALPHPFPLSSPCATHSHVAKTDADAQGLVQHV